MLEKKLRFDKKETCGFWGNRLIFWVVICLWVSVLGCREKEPSEAPMSSTPSVVVEPISLVITEPAKKAIEIDLQIAYSQQAMLWANGRLTTYSLLGQPQQGDPENPYSCAALLKFGQQKLALHKQLSGISQKILRCAVTRSFKQSKTFVCSVRPCETSLKFLLLNLIKFIKTLVFLISVFGW
jgi:hypothetical protein